MYDEDDDLRTAKGVILALVAGLALLSLLALFFCREPITSGIHRHVAITRQASLEVPR